MQYHWGDCPAAIRAQVTHLVAALAHCLGDELIGSYLHGSLAMGCFNPDRSDIDLLFITRQPLPAEAKRAIAEIVLHYADQPRPLELSVLLLAVLHPWQYPTPYDLHYSSDWHERVSRAIADGGWRTWPGVETLRDSDLAAHITIVGQRGVCLQGQPIAAVFPAVPPADYVHSVLRDIDDALANIAGNPVYALLNCCRVHWYLCEGQICSKDEAGSWALGTWPSVFQPLIRQALARYRGEAINAPFASADLQRFADYMQEHIHRLIPTDELNVL